MIFDSSGEEAYHLMDGLALKVPAGTEGVMAFIGPSAMNMNHLGMRYGGFLFPLPTSVTGVSQGHLVRASLENLCYAIKANCLQLEEVSGLRITEASIGGGMIKNLSLTQILPAVLSIPVRVSEIDQVSGLGAAICAAAGAGIYSSVEEAVEAMKLLMRQV